MWLKSSPHMLTLATVERYSQLSLKDCLALQQFFVAHSRVNQQAHCMAPMAYPLMQKYLASSGNQAQVALTQSGHATTTPSKSLSCSYSSSVGALSIRV
jgi:hypothetical protein